MADNVTKPERVSMGVTFVSVDRDTPHLFPPSVQDSRLCRTSILCLPRRILPIMVSLK